MNSNSNNNNNNNNNNTNDNSFRANRDTYKKGEALVSANRVRTLGANRKRDRNSQYANSLDYDINDSHKIAKDFDGVQFYKGDRIARESIKVYDNFKAYIKFDDLEGNMVKIPIGDIMEDKSVESFITKNRMTKDYEDEEFEEELRKANYTFPESESLVFNYIESPREDSLLDNIVNRHVIKVEISVESDYFNDKLFFYIDTYCNVLKDVAKLFEVISETFVVYSEYELEIKFGLLKTVLTGRCRGTISMSEHNILSNKGENNIRGYVGEFNREGNQGTEETNQIYGIKYKTLIIYDESDYEDKLNHLCERGFIRQFYSKTERYDAFSLWSVIARIARIKKIVVNTYRDKDISNGLYGVRFKLILDDKFLQQTDYLRMLSESEYNDNRTIRYSRLKGISTRSAEGLTELVKNIYGIKHVRGKRRYVPKERGNILGIEIYKVNIEENIRIKSKNITPLNTKGTVLKVLDAGLETKWEFEEDVKYTGLEYMTTNKPIGSIGVGRAIDFSGLFKDARETHTTEPLVIYNNEGNAELRRYYENYEQFEGKKVTDINNIVRVKTVNEAELFRLLYKLSPNFKKGVLGYIKSYSSNKNLLKEFLKVISNYSMVILFLKNFNPFNTEFIRQNHENNSYNKGAFIDLVGDQKLQFTIKKDYKINKVSVVNAFRNERSGLVYRSISKDFSDDYDEE